MQQAYGKASEEKLVFNTQNLFLPVKCNLQVEVNIQITTMSFPSGSHKIFDQQLIDAAIMKLKGRCVMCAKMIEK